ncbi:MAG: TIGR01212 family radical SAM protein [Acholeplasmataceae bacterium]
MTAEKHYQTLSNYYRHVYQRKVFKVPLNGGFSCPNIDGTVGSGGCSFCSSAHGGEFAGNPDEPLKVQFEKGLRMMHRKWKDAYYIVYFQANTNTHAPLARLKELFETAIRLDPRIVMISIATRPDALSDGTISYLADLNRRMPVQVELGLQTIHETTAEAINRCHDLATFDRACHRLAQVGIEVVAHIINGLPGETKNMMLATALHLNALPIDGVKIHMLNVVENSKMGADYKRKPWPLLSLEDYVDIVIEQILRLRKDIIIHRLTGDADPRTLIAPRWIVDKFVILNRIDRIMRERDLYQGDHDET